MPGCANTPAIPDDIFNTYYATVYNGVQATRNEAFGIEKFKLSLGVNNLFAEDPPVRELRARGERGRR